MKEKPSHVLVMVALGWLGMELLFPPVLITQWSSDWGGHWHTQNARRGLEKFGTSELWQVDGGLLAMESLLVVAALSIGATSLRRTPSEELDGSDDTASRAFARCATVLHGGLIFLPVCSAGADTVWLLNPFLLLVATPLLIPNFVAFLIAMKLGSAERRPVGGLAAKRWIMPFLMCTSCLWSVLLIVGVTGVFDVNTPLSGAMLATLALWLTVLARARSTTLPHVR
jgi:hypothetical protein